MKRKRYTVTDGKMVRVLEAAEEGGYCVACPFDPGLITQADSLEEAFEMAYDAAALLRAARRQKWKDEEFSNAKRKTSKRGPKSARR